MIVTLNDTKEYLNIDLADTSKDTAITNLILVAGAKINTICGQNIESGTNVVTFKGFDNDKYIVNKFPVTAVTKVESKYYSESVFTEDDINNYSIIPDNNITSIYNIASDFESNYVYRVTFTSGYATIPYDVRNIAYEMVSIMLKESEIKPTVIGGRIGMQSFSEGLNGVSGNTSFKDMEKSWRERLNKYTTINIIQ